MSKPVAHLKKKDPFWRERIVLVVGWTMVAFTAIIISFALFAR